MAIASSPTAIWAMTATRELSTPPENATKTRPNVFNVFSTDVALENSSGVTRAEI